jgi:hypothetical protein
MTLTYPSGEVLHHVPLLGTVRFIHPRDSDSIGPSRPREGSALVLSNDPKHDFHEHYVPCQIAEEEPVLMQHCDHRRASGCPSGGLN